MSDPVQTKALSGELPGTKDTTRTFLQDFSASLVVFLVALPLCMGIAVASGVPIAAGVITGIIGGFIVGWFAGSPLQVSGPAAGLTVLVFQIVTDPLLGVGVLGLIVLGAGLLQIVAGVLRLGQWFRAVSPAVIEGMLAGIGLLLAASQFHVMVDDTPKSGGLKNLLSIPDALEKVFNSHDLTADEVAQAGLTGQQAEQAELTPEQAARAGVTVEQASRDGLTPAQAGKIGLTDEQGARIHRTHDEAAQIGLLTIAVLVLWKLFGAKKLKLIPGPLLAIVVATTLALILQGCGVWPNLKPVNMPPELWNEIHLPSGESFSRLGEQKVLLAIFSVAFIASAETLLCATAIDQLHTGPRTKYDKELIAQGIGNTLCGFVGALPMTGVIVRSATNVEAGARTRASAILHGAWFILLLVLLPLLLQTLLPPEVLDTLPTWLAVIIRTAPWVSLIPKASLAAVLVYTGYKLINFETIKRLWTYGWGEVAIYFVTMFTIVATDLLVGVLVGIGMSMIKLLFTFSQLNVRLESVPSRNQTVLHIEGAATFIRLPQLAAALEKVPSATELHVQFDHLSYIDHACLTLLMNWEKQHEAVGGSLVIDWESLHARFRAGPQSNGTKTRDNNSAAEASAEPSLARLVK